MSERPALKKTSLFEPAEILYSREESAERKKKKRISRIITIVDGGIVVLLLVFLSIRNQNDNSAYATASAASQGLISRFSVNLDKETGDFIFSLTLRSDKGERSLKLLGSAASLTLRHKGNVFYRQELGIGVSEIVLLPGETKTFPAQIPAEIIDAYLSDILPDKKKKSLFEFKDDSEIVTAEASVNLINPISVSLEFKRKAPYD